MLIKDTNYFDFLTITKQSKSVLGVSTCMAFVMAYYLGLVGENVIHITSIGYHGNRKSNEVNNSYEQLLCLSIDTVVVTILQGAAVAQW